MRLTVIRGVPGSGKSTMATQMWHHPGIMICEADEYFMRDGRYQFDANKLPEAHEYCIQKTEKALKNGYDVIVANTFIRRWELWPYEILAQRYNADFIELRATGNFKNVHGVPDEVIVSMKLEFEK